MAATLDLSFDEAIEHTDDPLKTDGFGVLARVDVQQILKTKINADFRPYTILGPCNPELAHQALLLEDKVGTMLPCNVIVQQLDDRKVEVAAINPVASMQAIDNPALKRAASAVLDKLSRVMAALTKTSGQP